MSDGGEARAPLRPNREDARHEAAEPDAPRRQVEIAIRALDRRDRRERPELLAILDLAVEAVACLNRVRRGENAAMAEGAGAELRGAVHPADDAAGGELVGDALDQLSLAKLFDLLPVFSRRPRQLVAVHRRPPERMIRHVAIRIAEIDPVRVERGAQCTAGIAWRRRHEDALEARLGENARVRDAVERHAAAKT